LRIERRAAADHHGADRRAGHPSRKVHRCLSGEEVTAPGIAGSRGVEYAWREDVLLLDTGHLLAQALDDGAQRIGRRCIRKAVVNGVDAEQSVLLRDIVVEAGGPEVFPDCLQRVAEGFGDAAA
jgi:hypothetical protein